MYRKHTLLALPLLAGALAHAAPEPAAPPVVEVSGSRNQQRQQDSAAAMVVGRDELTRFGDPTLADALKRVPGITAGGVPGRPGALQMRGLGNGYTQILLNGQPMPNGFSLETIAPDLVERVEVRRVATAEMGAQAIAGTINIVLRKSVGKARRELTSTLGVSDGHPSASVAGQLSGKSGTASYVVAATAAENRTDNHYADEELGTGEFLVERTRRRREQSLQRIVTISPRLDLGLANGDALSSQSFVRLFQLANDNAAREHTAVGAPTAFPDNHAFFDATAATMSSDLQWTRTRDDGHRWELKAGVSQFVRSADFGFFSDDGIGARHVGSHARERVFKLSGKWSRTAPGGHALAAGWDGATGERSETRRERSSVAADPVKASDEHYGAALERLAVFVQDDWSINPAWSLTAGLRWEALSTRTTGNVLAHVRQRSRVVVPSLQALHKLSASDQLRLGLARTYKAPTMIALAQRRLSVDNGNSQVNPDYAGNPLLVPERAWGLDLAYERYIGKSGLVSVGAYARRIDDVIATRLTRQGLRYVSIPSNQGRADTWGLELEAKLPLRALWAGATAIDLRANLVRNWSRMHAVAGPDNRLDGQVPLSANLGFDYRMAGAPVALGMNFAFQGGGAVRLSDTSAEWNSPSRALELFGNWQVSARGKWQLSLANLLHQRQRSVDRFADADGALQMRTDTPTAATVRLTYSHSFDK
ncbi:TonB-dependent receptor plug domain-containing protein [Massilia glaciei]|uniref:TonB-dependent receptor n=1 Tax=Massilia glaciei TaxID=1524097 RepID=A0A2U2HIP8_9BURK|nr:TonB-dependent receptor [Massilia glaciei]PWF46684.1 TonB-dependent receptor [Massilia glaciei]